MRWIGLLLALGLVGCLAPRERGGGGGGDDDDTVEDDDDANDDDDAVEDDDDATDDDDEVGPCGVYDPYDQVGAWWAWELQPDYVDTWDYDSWWTTEAMGQTTWRGQPAWRMRTVGEMDHPAYDWYAWEVDAYYICDGEGVWSLGYENSSSWSFGGEPDSLQSSRFNTTPWLLRPAGLEAGDSWHATGIGDYWDSNGNESTGPIDIDYTALEYGAVQTPAGTFEGLRVVSEASEENTSWFWLVEGVGVVLTEDYSWMVDTSL